ncbi:MAG: minichromosome maintenance protein MCM, partial [Thaumarchaeota archaeon]|nr:minichromosome maintenance protein MCM [Nitrososphaerota archaeon]
MSKTQTSTFTDSALSDKVKEFLTRFKDSHGIYKYVEAIDEMMPKNAKYIIVDYNDLVVEPEIEVIFAENPDRLFDAFSRAIKEALQTRFPDYAEKIKDEVRARLINFPLERSLRQINAETIGHLTSVSGMVVRASEVKPLAKELVFVCADEHQTKVIQLKGMDVKIPVVCDNPSCKHRDFDLKPEASKFIDFQILRLQELPEDLPPGQLPHYIDVTIRQDLVDNSRPGDRIILTGVVRIEQESVAGVQRGHSGLYRLRIEGNNIEFLGGRGVKTDRKIAREEVSPEDEKMIKALGQSPDVYQRLIDSFAPHIKGQSLIKEAILLLIVGSNQRILGDGSKIRGDINVFLVGDPGTAKSEMLKFCARIAPRGLYTSGRGSTAAGLTAAVVRDKTGIMMLEAGAVVLGDQGLVSIDEFDKMKPEDRSALHEVMEQQSASIAKGGIVATLNARTSILAAANPMYGKYDPFKNITENVNLPIPLLTRFDLIFVVRDIPTKEKD